MGIKNIFFFLGILYIFIVYFLSKKGNFIIQLYKNLILKIM